MGALAFKLSLPCVQPLCSLQCQPLHLHTVVSVVVLLAVTAVVVHSVFSLVAFLAVSVRVQSCSRQRASRLLPIGLALAVAGLLCASPPQSATGARSHPRRRPCSGLPCEPSGLARARANQSLLLEDLPNGSSSPTARGTKPRLARGPRRLLRPPAQPQSRRRLCHPPVRLPHHMPTSSGQMATHGPLMMTAPRCWLSALSQPSFVSESSRQSASQSEVPFLILTSCFAMPARSVTDLFRSVRPCAPFVGGF